MLAENGCDKLAGDSCLVVDCDELMMIMSVMIYTYRVEVTLLLPVPGRSGPHTRI